ncbi:DUF3631 domain-containing protein [Methyloglobulus sp.]|uniref:DUF3631 domain-containing protein n=1 Tax=Methyloglobulus sp. TaxID=2518622 RepID=UPI003989A52D
MSVRKATAAALKLSGDCEKSHSINNELLADIRQIFELKRTDFISTIDLITELCTDDDAAWATYNKGKQISGRQVSRLLNPYGIEPKQQRLTTTNNPKRGYLFADFEDVFIRYLSETKTVAPDTPEIIRYTLQNDAKPVITRAAAVTDDKSVTLQNDLSVTNTESNHEAVTDNSICNVTEKQSVTTQGIDYINDNGICNGVTDKNGSVREHVSLADDMERF